MPKTKKHKKQPKKQTRKSFLSLFGQSKSKDKKFWDSVEFKNYLLLH